MPLPPSEGANFAKRYSDIDDISDKYTCESEECEEIATEGSPLGRIF